MIIQTSDQLNDLIVKIYNEDMVVVDTETNGLRPFHGDKIVGLAFYFPFLGESFYAPVRHDMSNSSGYRNLTEDEYAGIVEAWNTRSYKGKFVYFNASFDVHMMYQDGFNDPEHIEDVMLAAHLLNENEDLSNGSGDPNSQFYRPKNKGAYTLKRLARKYLGEWAGEGEDELKDLAKELGLDAKSDIYKLPLEPVAKYAEFDVIITWELREFYYPALEKWSIIDLYERRNDFLMKTLIRMERNGMRVNTDTIRQHQAQLGPRTAAVGKEIDEEARRMGLNYDPINPNSPQQMLAFYNLRGHKISSTNSYTLEKLDDPFAQKLLDYRGLSKANSTYYDPYLYHVDSNGLVHASLNPIGTVSGRLSSYAPNFQQIPKTEYNDDGTPNRDGKYIVKEVFEPHPGYSLVEIDYSQLELRIGVHYANEETMRGMFLSGVDMHQFTADRLNVSRFKGKTANFSFVYGMGKKTGAIRLKTTEKEAKKIIEGWHSLYPAFRKAYITMQEVAKKWRYPGGAEGGNFQYIQLPDGRLRRYHEFIKYPYWNIKHVDANGKRLTTEPPYYTAWNTLVQGTASGVVMEQSLLRIALAFPDNNIVRLLLTVHDSVILEIRNDMVKPVIAEIRKLMTDWNFNPPLDVDVKISTKNWFEMEHYNA